MSEQPKPMVYAALGGAAAGVLVGLLGRTKFLAPAEGETQNEAVARLLTRSGSAAILAGIGVAVYSEKADWRPVALGAIGAGTLLFVSGVTMSREPSVPALPAQAGAGPTKPIQANVLSSSPTQG